MFATQGVHHLEARHLADLGFARTRFRSFPVHAVSTRGIHRSSTDRYEPTL